MRLMLLAAALLAPLAALAADPLPSLNAGEAKSAILDFVAEAADPASAEFVPEPQRVAVFDNDGTLWSEQPVYFQFFFAMDRAAALAAGDFRAWTVAGVWAHVHDVLYRRTRELEGREESPTAAIIDSQSAKTSAEAREMVGYDAGKRIKGRKRHLVTDTLGLMLRIEVHSASLQDRDGAALVLDRITGRFPFLERIFADAGYQGPRVSAVAPRPVEIIKRTDTGFVVQPKRWVIERTFAWACINRRLARDVERAAETVRALFQIAMIKLMARRIARYRHF